MQTIDSQQPTGILNPQASTTKFQLARHAPSHDIGAFVLRYWIITWDLRGQPPYTQEVVSHPCVNMVFERGKTLIYGIADGKSAHVLAGKGRVFGVKFRPGGFYPFVNMPVARLTNCTMRLEEVFAVDSAMLEAQVLAAADAPAMIDIVEDMLRAHLPAPDPQVECINQIVNHIAASQTITKVDEVARHFHMSARTLQRMFRQSVGVSPKWVIKQCRLREAAARLHADEPVDWPRLALDLGYFDQAHFIKDFKHVVGTTPVTYARHPAEAQARSGEQYHVHYD
jgi:AraC-like DNA-binding protein